MVMRATPSAPTSIVVLPIVSPVVVMMESETFSSFLAMEIEGFFYFFSIYFKSWCRVSLDSEA